MRNFIFDVWVWSKAKHSRLLKQIRVKALSFPSDMFCLNEAAKDADVSPYMKSDEFEVTIGNLRDYQGATFFDRNFHFDLPTDLTNVSKLLFTGYFSTYRVTVDADSITNNAVCQSGVTTEIPINQAYIGGDTANISINVII